MMNKEIYYFTPEQLEGINRVTYALAQKAVNVDRQLKRGIITREEAREHTIGALTGVRLSLIALYGKRAEACLEHLNTAIYNLTAGTPEQEERARDYLTVLVELLDR